MIFIKIGFYYSYIYLPPKKKSLYTTTEYYLFNINYIGQFISIFSSQIIVDIECDKMFVLNIQEILSGIGTLLNSSLVILIVKRHSFFMTSLTRKHFIIIIIIYVFSLYSEKCILYILYNHKYVYHTQYIILSSHNLNIMFITKRLIQCKLFLVSYS